MQWAEIAKKAREEQEKKYKGRRDFFPGQKRIEDLELEVYYLKDALRNIVQENIRLLYLFEMIGESVNGHDLKRSKRKKYLDPDLNFKFDDEEGKENV